MSERATVKVLMSPELMEQWASRDIDGNRMLWSWGEPDADGFHTPTVTTDTSDNSAAAERERLRGEGITMVAAIDAEMRRQGNTESADAFPPIMADFLRALLSPEAPTDE